MAVDYSKLSDKELTELVAVEVMGWEKGKYTSKSGDIRNMPCWRDKNGEIVDEDSEEMRWFDPLENWNWTMQVVEKIMGTDKKIDFCLGSSQLIPRWSAIFIPGGMSQGKDPQRAICIAALSAKL